MCRSGGATLIELVMVMTILGIVTIVVLPRLENSTAFRAVAFRDQVVSALRYAQKSAVSHHRLVCAEVAASTVTLSIASTNPASACTAILNRGQDPAYARSDYPADASASLSPAGILHFQPSGVVSADAAGTAITDYRVTVTGMTPITLSGATGYVE